MARGLCHTRGRGPMRKETAAGHACDPPPSTVLLENRQGLLFTCPRQIAKMSSESLLSLAFKVNRGEPISCQ